MIGKIAFWTLITVAGLWLIWELIPDHTKKWWGYILQVKRDRRKGLKGKYIFTWRK